MKKIFSTEFIDKVINDFQKEITNFNPKFELSNNDIDINATLVDIFQYNSALKRMTQLKELYDQENQHELNKEIIKQKIKNLARQVSYENELKPIKINVTNKFGRQIPSNDLSEFKNYFLNTILIYRIKEINYDTNDDFYFELLKYDKKHSFNNLIELMEQEMKGYSDFIKTASYTKKVSLPVSKIE